MQRALSFKFRCHFCGVSYNTVERYHQAIVWWYRKLRFTVSTCSTFTAIHYLHYHALLAYWPRSSVGRASEDLIWRSWVQTPTFGNETFIKTNIIVVKIYAVPTLHTILTLHQTATLRTILLMVLNLLPSWQYHLML